MSDQDNVTDKKNDQPHNDGTSKSATSSSTMKVARKKAVSKKTSREKTAGKVAKQTVTRKQATVKKASTKKKATKKTTARNKAAKKATDNEAAVREREKQAVSDALRAAVSAGGDLMKANSEQTSPEAQAPQPEIAEPSTAEQSGPGAQSGLTPADDAAAREMEKKAVGDALLAAVNAAGSLMQPNDTTLPPSATSVRATGDTGDEPRVPVDSSRHEQAPRHAAIAAVNSDDSPVSIPQQGQHPDQHPAEPVPAATRRETTGPGGGGLPVELEKPQTITTKSKRWGIIKRLLLIILILAGLVLLASMLTPVVDYISPMPDSDKGAPTADERSAERRTLPVSQMRIIHEVFAPEMKDN